MERFEPAGQPSSPPSTSLDYRLAATVVTSIKEETDAVKILNPFNRTLNDVESLEAVGSVNHIYSYAYYGPGSIKCHSNIPPEEIIEKCKNEQINSRRNLLSKEFRCKVSGEQNTSLPLEDRHTYTTHYGTTENLYEEIKEKSVKNVLSDNRMLISSNCVKEEFLRVQHNHFRVLEELNLSLEALIMPPNLVSNNIKGTTGSIVHCRGDESGLASAVVTSNKILPQKRRNKFSSTSLEDISETFQSIGLKDNFQNSSNNAEFDEEDLDSGFSGSGISYNEGLRYYKTSATPQTRSNAFSKNSYNSPSPSAVYTTKSDMASQQTTSTANKQCCKNLLPEKTSHEITSFNGAHRYLDMHHLCIRSTPAAHSTGS